MAIHVLVVNGRRAFYLLRRPRRRPAYPVYFRSTDPARLAHAHRMAFTAGARAGDASQAAARVLNRHGYRVLSDESGDGTLQLRGEKGSFGRWGSILFHLSMLVVLAGGLITATGGSSGLMVITEGQTLRDRPPDYLIAPKKRWANDFSDVALRLDKLALDYYNGWTVSDMAAQFSVVQDGREQKQTARINEPLQTDATAFVLDRYGFAPLFVLTDAQGREQFRSYVNLTVLQVGQQDSFKISGTPLEVAVRLYPDVAVADSDTGFGSVSLRPLHPVAYVTVVEEGEREVFRGPLTLNGEVRLSGEGVSAPNAELSFEGLRYWARLRAVKNPGEPVLFSGFWLAIVGLILRFAFVERVVAVRLKPEAAGVLVEVAGRAEQCNALYGEEFGGLVAAMAREVELGAQRDIVLLAKRSTISS